MQQHFRPIDIADLMILLDEIQVGKCVVGIDHIDRVFSFSLTGFVHSQHTAIVVIYVANRRRMDNKVPIR